MAPLIPDNVDCDKLKIAHPSCPSTSSVVPDRDGTDEPLVGPPGAGEPGLEMVDIPDWTDQDPGLDLEDDNEEMTEEVEDNLPHPASPPLHEQGEETTLATTIMTQGMAEVSTDVTIVLDTMDSHEDHENNTDWVMIGSMVCIIAVMAILAGEWFGPLYVIQQLIGNF